jgi:hypothetical protein
VNSGDKIAMTCIGKIAFILGVFLLFIAGALSLILWHDALGGAGFRLIPLEHEIRTMVLILAVIGVAAIVLGRPSGRADSELKKGLGLNDSSSDKQ